MLVAHKTFRMPANNSEKALRILVVDDEEQIRFALQMCLESNGHKVVAQRSIEDAIKETARQAFDLIFIDVKLGAENWLDYIPALIRDNPWGRIIAMTAYASIQTAVDAIKLGASDYLPKPFENSQLLLLTRKVAERRQLERKMEAIQTTFGSADPERDFLTASPLWRESIELARRVATSNVAVLIQGEVGTGRGRLARAIHEWSLRSQEPFMAVSLRRQSDESMEATLFGGARDSGDSTGAVAMCHEGTLVLEEIAEMPLRLQPRLVALLRDKEFERADALRRQAIDVRIVATSSVDLENSVRAGTFREDLSSALNVVRIDVPALRERAEDIPLLAGRYLTHYAKEHRRQIVGFTQDAMLVLNNYNWPGNIRELRNVIERASLLANSEYIDREQLPAELINASVGGTNQPCEYEIGALVPLEVIEESHIRSVIASAKSIRKAATILGLAPSTLCRKLRTYKNKLVSGT